MTQARQTHRPSALHRRIASVLSLGALMFLLGFPPAAMAADDPSIQGELRQGIQESMSRLIERNTVGGIYRHYDPVKGDLLELRLKELHAGIVKKGEFYVSCADFSLPNGEVVDLDFLVVADGNTLVASQAIVHKRDGAKRPYHLEAAAVGGGR